MSLRPQIGRSAIPQSQFAAVIPRPAPRPIAHLTARECEVMYWVGEGKRDREIAIILNLSPRTIEKHLSHILDKLGVETRTGAVNEFRESLPYLESSSNALNEHSSRSKQKSKGAVKTRRASPP